jgi:hypothetical protein
MVYEAICKPPQSYPKARCLGGDWEVHARYMRGTCVIRARYKPGKSGVLSC